MQQSSRSNETDALDGNFLGPASKAKFVMKSWGCYSLHFKRSGSDREKGVERRERNRGRRRERNTGKRGCDDFKRK